MNKNGIKTINQVVRKMKVHFETSHWHGLQIRAIGFIICTAA